MVDWKAGESARAGALVKVRTRPSVLYGYLFAALGEFAKGVEYILLGVLIFFAHHRIGRADHRHAHDDARSPAP